MSQIHTTAHVYSVPLEQLELVASAQHVKLAPSPTKRRLTVNNAQSDESRLQETDVCSATKRTTRSTPSPALLQMMVSSQIRTSLIKSHAPVGSLVRMARAYCASRDINQTSYARSVRAAIASCTIQTEKAVCPASLELSQIEHLPQRSAEEGR